MRRLAQLANFGDRDWDTGLPDETIRFAMIGLGNWTVKHAIPALIESDYCEASVVVSSSPEKSRQVTTNFDGISHAIDYDQFHEGAVIDEYDAVYIATPNALHLDFAKTAAQYGKHVLCEKPMEISSERALEMINVCETHNVTLMIAYRMQTEPAVRRAREMIADGIIGDPIQAHSSFSSLMLEHNPDFNQWRLNPELSGGCAVIDVGLYPLNTLRYILNLDPLAVSAMTLHTHDAFSDVDEHGVFQLQFPHGITAACAVTRGASRSSHLSIVGTDGKLRIEPAFFPTQDRALTVEQGSTRTDLSFEQCNQMKEEFDHFAHAVLTGDSPDPTGYDGLVDIRTVEAIYDSSESEKVIHLDT